MTEQTTETQRPEWGTEDYRRYAVLFNDITRAPIQDFLLFSDRRLMADHLWAQGWRREVRPEDVTEHADPPETALPPDAPWPREECGDRGPRVGENVTICRRSKGHDTPHRTAPSDGFGKVEWSTLRPEVGR